VGVFIRGLINHVFGVIRPDSRKEISVSKNRKWTRVETRVWEFSGVRPADQRSFGRLIVLAVVTLVIVWGAR
jgi:hypothetical protein